MRPRRAVLVASLLLAVAAPGELGGLARAAVVDAFTAVSAFVAGTLALFYGAERVARVDLGRALQRRRRLQVPFAALLGATPGCGGAVAVVAAYSSGNVSFGAVVAALTATMGDAAFLLLTSEPDTGLLVVGTCLVAGVLTGWIIDASKTAPVTSIGTGAGLPRPVGRALFRHRVYLALLALGLIQGVSKLMASPWLGEQAELTLALSGTFTGMLVWASSSLEAMTHPDDPASTRAAEETAFISVAVLIAFLAYVYLTTLLGIDLRATFSVIGPLLPLMGVLVGFVPGCGPQILVTTLYLNGVAPMSALIGNAIANDGDALFPAIALHPRAAIVATLYSGLPALLVAYLTYFLVP